MQGWYVAKVKPRGEHQLSAYLARFSTEVYAPEILVMRRGRKRLEPLFPTYVFVHTDPTSAVWPAVRWARGLRYFLGDRQEPTPCPDGFVETIQESVEKWNGGGWESAFHPGDSLVLRWGRFQWRVPRAGMECSFWNTVVSNQQKWDTVGAERSGAGWRSGELPEGPVVASSLFGGLSLHLLPAL